MSTYEIKDCEDFDDVGYGEGDWELVVEGDWTQDYKYQHLENIVLHKPTGKYYKFENSRSGSPYTDWDYKYNEHNLPILQEVFKEVVVVEIVKWVEVK